MAIHQAVARFKTFVSFQDLNRAGRPKVTSQSEKEDGSALTHHFKQKDSTRFAAHRCRW